MTTIDALMAANVRDLYRLTMKERLPKNRLKELHSFYAHGEKTISSHFFQKGVLNFPSIANVDEFLPLLPIHILTSDHTIIQLPRSDSRDVDICYTSSRSSYDDMGHSYESTLLFGNAEVIAEIYRECSFLFDSGLISLIPEHSVADQKGCGAPEPVNFARLLSKNHAAQMCAQASALREIIFPVIIGAKRSDFLKLVSDEWEAFEKCRVSLLAASRQLSAHIDHGDFDVSYQRIKCEIIDDGIDVLERRLAAVKRKGFLDAINSTLGSAALCWANLNLGGPIGFVGNAIAAAIFGTSTYANYIQYREGNSELGNSRHYFLLRARQLGETSRNA